MVNIIYKKMLSSLLAMAVLLPGCKKSIDEYIDKAIKEFVLDGFYESAFDLHNLNTVNGM